jgi:hypothetical protein
MFEEDIKIAKKVFSFDFRILELEVADKKRRDLLTSKFDEIDI